MKLSFKKIRENETGMIHLQPPPGLDQVTLCGLTDWLGGPGGKEIEAAVTCFPCRMIADYCQAHRRMPKPRRTSLVSSQHQPPLTGER